jgi:hypothetical protein
MRWHADTEQHRAASAGFGRQGDSPFNRSPGAGNDDLSGRIEIDGTDDLPLAGFLAGFNNALIVQSKNGGHATSPKRDSFLHEFRTIAKEGQRRLEVYGFGADQCRVLAETMARHHRRHSAAGASIGTPRCDAGREHRRLGYDSCIEFLSGAVLYQLPKVITKYVTRLCVTLAHVVPSGAKIRLHTDGLRALSRKYHGCCQIRVSR